jgi:LPXTG-site transpeptidase (sortase) family protein
MTLRPVILRAPIPNPLALPLKSRKKRSRFWLHDFAYMLVILVACFVTTLAGFHIYLQLSSWNASSGGVYIQKDTERIYLVQPTAVVTPPVRSTPALPDAAPSVPSPAPPPPLQPGQDGDVFTDESSDDTPNGDAQPTGTAAAAPARADVPLPPVGLQIPAIQLDVPVMLTTSDSLPSRQYAGWFFRSAFPATAGNMVILGHLDGDAAVFSRLDELVAGDELRVLTNDHVHVYIVESTSTVDASAVDVLAPTDRAMATLITCAGDWNWEQQSYESRLVVRAHYVAVEAHADNFDPAS